MRWGHWLSTAMTLLLLPAPAAAAVKMLSCTADRAVNDGTGERLPLPDAPFLHRLTPAEAQKESFSRTEHLSDGTAESAIEHQVDLKAGTFRAISSHTRHDLGESYLITISGKCVSIDR